MELNLGETYEFRAHGRYNKQFHGVLEKLYEHSVMVYLPETNDRAIISKKYVLKHIKTKKSEETKRMKFNLKTATLLLPATIGAEGKECMVISKSGVALSGSVVRRLNKPKWVQLYFDEAKQAFFVLPCQATDEGARSCVSLKPNKKAGYRKSWKGRILKTVAEVAKMDIENHRYYVDPEEVEGYPTALGFDLTKAVKN
ncbi:hypothetical protein [Enterococcus sp. DIV1420a]|uniref:hypothetical protein n=1 Tax=Enterococcus sp. DIV1420a TaxID=2774672 RepID=UPI003F29403B